VSTNRERLAAVETEMSDNDKKQSTLREEEYHLSVKRHDIINDILMEEKPLQGTEWELTVGSQGRVYLRYMGSRQDEVMEPISEMCSRSWHDDFSVAEGISIQFDDNEVSLAFEDSRLISIFAQKQNLTIVAPGVVDKMRQLSRELATLETLSHQFNLKG
jgi:hypothetical protein